MVAGEPLFAAAEYGTMDAKRQAMRDAGQHVFDQVMNKANKGQVRTLCIVTMLHIRA